MINVDVPPEEFGAVARKLLDAADELGLPASVVATTSDGLFGMGLLVPDEVAEKAGLTTKAKEAKADTPAKRGPGRPRKSDQEE